MPRGCLRRFSRRNTQIANSERSCQRTRAEQSQLIDLGGCKFETTQDCRSGSRALIIVYSIVTSDHANYVGCPSLLVQHAVVLRSNSTSLVGSTFSSISDMLEVTQASCEI